MPSMLAGSYVPANCLRLTSGDHVLRPHIVYSFDSTHASMVTPRIGREIVFISGGVKRIRVRIYITMRVDTMKEPG